jgi:hypothetical protein
MNKACKITKNMFGKYLCLFQLYPLNVESEMLLDQNAEGNIKPQYRIFFQQLTFQITFYVTLLATAIIRPWPEPFQSNLFIQYLFLEDKLR